MIRPSPLALCLFAIVGGTTFSCEDDPKLEYSILADSIPGGGALLSVTSNGEEAIFVGGELQVNGSGKGVIVHYDGDSLCVESTKPDHTLWWVHSARPGEWYAVGEAGTILHEVAGVRTDESVATDAILYGVWDNGDRVIAVGGTPFTDRKGEVWVKENGVWSQLAADLPGVTFKVWNQWIVGNGVAYHLEGDTLVERHPPANTLLRTVVGRSDDDVWAVGSQQGEAVLHWNGSEWESIEINPFCLRGGGLGLNGAFTSPDDDVWVAGFDGTMSQFDGEWHCADFNNPPTAEHFHAVGKHKDEFLWAGGNMNTQGNNYGTIGIYTEGKKNLPVTTCD